MPFISSLNATKLQLIINFKFQMDFAQESGNQLERGDSASQLPSPDKREPYLQGDTTLSQTLEAKDFQRILQAHRKEYEGEKQRVQREQLNPKVEISLQPKVTSYQTHEGDASQYQSILGDKTNAPPLATSSQSSLKGGQNSENQTKGASFPKEKEQGQTDSKVQEQLQRQKEENEHLAKQNLELLQRMKAMVMQQKENEGVIKEHRLTVEESSQDGLKDKAFESVAVKQFQESDINDQNEQLRLKLQEKSSQINNQGSRQLPFLRREQQTKTDAKPQKVIMLAKHQVKKNIQSIQNSVSSSTLTNQVSNQCERQKQNNNNIKEQQQPDHFSKSLSLNQLNCSPSKSSPFSNSVIATSRNSKQHQILTRLHPTTSKEQSTPQTQQSISKVSASSSRMQRQASAVQIQTPLGAKSGSQTQRCGSVSKRTPSQMSLHEKNYIRNMLQNSVLSCNDDKIDFLVSEIEVGVLSPLTFSQLYPQAANTKISMLQEHLQGYGDDRTPGKVSGQSDRYSHTLAQEVTMLKVENNRLRDCLTRRTDEANNSIIQVSSPNTELHTNNNQYLQLIEQLPTELLKQKQQQQHQLSLQTPTNGRQNLYQHWYTDQEEVQQLRQETMRLSADFKALSERHDELFSEKNQLEQDYHKELVTAQSLKESVLTKDETIKKLKKKIVSAYIKDKISGNEINVGSSPNALTLEETEGSPSSFGRAACYPNQLKQSEKAYLENLSNTSDAVNNLKGDQYEERYPLINILYAKGSKSNPQSQVQGRENYRFGARSDETIQNKKACLTSPK